MNAFLNSNLNALKNIIEGVVSTLTVVVPTIKNLGGILHHLLLILILYCIAVIIEFKLSHDRFK